MADIVCSYQLENQDSTSGYLVFAGNLSLSDLQKHFSAHFQLPKCILLSENSQEISSDAALRTLISMNASVTLIIRDPSIPINSSPAATVTNANGQDDPMVLQEQNPIPASKLVLGETVRAVLTHHGVTVKSEYESVEDLLQSVPFARCLQKKFNKMRNHPRWFHSKVHRIANKANVDPEQFREEISVLLDHVDAAPPARKTFNCAKCQQPIQGVRYQCLTCRKYSLCSDCEALNIQEGFHSTDHVFAKLTRPDHKFKKQRHFVKKGPWNPHDSNEEGVHGHRFHHRFSHPFIPHGRFHHRHHFDSDIRGRHHFGRHRFHDRPQHHPGMHPPHRQVPDRDADSLPPFERFGHLSTKVGELEQAVADLRLKQQEH